MTGAARELARNAELKRQENGVYELVVPKAKAYLADRAYVDKLKAALDQHLGAAVRVNVSVGEVAGASAAALEATEREARRAEALKSVQGDGFVQDLVNIFEAKVVDSSIRETREMKGNIGQLMKQAQQMQENMRRMQESLATIEVEGQSGAGMVKVLMTCKHDVKRVAIDPSLVGDDKDMLEDLVAAAFNDAAHKVEATIAEKMSGMTAGLGLPPGFKLPF